MELEVLKLFFPEELVAHFDITGSAIKQGKHGDYLEAEREGIEPSEILYFTVVMSFSPSLKAL